MASSTTALAVSAEQLAEELAEPVDDPRVSAVLAVLRGATLESAAAAVSVDPIVLQRWVGTFVASGTSTITQRPDRQIALQRTRFLAAFAFEIRGPLASVQRTVSLLTDRTGPSTDVVLVAKRLSGELSRLSDRVARTELLLGAALGGLEVNRRATTAGRLCQGLEGVGTIRGEGADYEVCVDQALMEQILGDMWTASASVPEPRYRHMWVRPVGQWVEFRIRRQGPPIDVRLLERMFEPFDKRGLTTGATIGLYLARALAVAHGGTLGVEQDGTGAAFWVRVPLISDTIEPPPAHQGRGQS